jgi:hypothetical protein
MDAEYTTLIKSQDISGCILVFRAATHSNGGYVTPLWQQMSSIKIFGENEESACGLIKL